MEISDWIEEDSFAYKYILGTDKNNPSNRVAMIEKTPRIQIVKRNDAISHIAISKYRKDKNDSFEDIEEFEQKGIWLYGWKGSNCKDKESRKWCDDLLNSIYGFKWS